MRWKDDLAVGPGEWGSARKALLDGQAIDYRGASGPIDFLDNGDPSRGRYALWRVTDDLRFDLSEGVEFDLE